ncbi:MAG TPA: glycosyltransferase [Mycobacterium sp.]|nr:glycosyltransferase [Mycobacterium sp.]HUH68756.1 glycosyltransferase [Mycobacterium sp.]
MKFVLATYGSRGDVEPFAAVGRELRRRGHDVLAAVPPNLRCFVESVGIAAVTFGPESPSTHDGDSVQSRTTEIVQNPFSTVTEIMWHLTQAWAQWDATLRVLADGADLVLTGRFEQGLAANVAEYYGIPLAALHFFPGGDWHPGGWLGRMAKQAAETQRRELGLPEAAGPSSGDMAVSMVIQAYDELCFPGLAAEWGEQARRRPFVGALTLELPTDADDEVLSWIDQGTPPIFFGFGSAVRVRSAADTAATISAVCAQLGERALIYSGSNDFTQIPHFDNVKVVGAVNHVPVFPACRAVVHHGGAGTTAAGLRAGIPTLVLWHEVDDQPIWGAAVTRLKVGLDREFSTTTPQSLIADLRSVLTPEYASRAREVAARMTKPAESVASTADLLEEAARTRGCG